jgi:nitrite reductase/ring-hydroxylating ferredoxin subunit
MDQPVDLSQDTVPQAVSVPVDAYISEVYAKLEREKLWSKVWQVAGRLEDMPHVGDYLTYEIMDDSILVVRTAPDEIKAYHNVCRHRGRRLVDTPGGEKAACGNATQFRCGFHGWRWNTRGENIFVQEKNDWGGALTPENLTLAPVKSGTWGGWVWINLDQIFPNFQIGHAVNNALCCNARPYGNDPNKCIFEAAVYELFPPGGEPKTKWGFTPPEDPAWRSVLPQDFHNMAAVQRGMKSSGFPRTKPNPQQEVAVVNLHKNLAAYMGIGMPHSYA